MFKLYIPGIVKLWESPRQSRGFTMINYWSSCGFKPLQTCLLCREDVVEPYESNSLGELSGMGSWY